ncbi:AAA family ATPase, partial [Streptomyces sp. P01-F02]|nr:AAA family ATPase [Streptomyces poriferorum]
MTNDTTTTVNGTTTDSLTTDSTTTDGVPDRATAAGQESRQVTPPEDRYSTELAFLAAHDAGPRPPGWLLTPRAVVTFVMGSAGEA